MKLLIISCLVAATVAAPASPSSYNPTNVQLLKFESANNGAPDFSYAYEQSDGTKGEAHGSLINAGQENAAVAIKGLYSFIIDGVTYTVQYTADEEGYHPTIEQGPGGAVPPGVVASLLGSEQSDGTWANSQGDLMLKATNDRKEVATLVIKGNFSFVIDGFRYNVNYIADQNGYLPTINRTLEPPDLDFRVSGPILASLLGLG